MIPEMAAEATLCRCCGAALPESGKCRDLFNELCGYSMTRQPERFLHQHAVDAFAAQHAAENPKPIATAAALIGLYLFVEKGWTGRQVQRAHMQLGNRMKEWPSFPLPEDRASINVATVLGTPEGHAKDAAIEDWARAVWRTWRPTHGPVRELLEGPYRVRP